MEQRVRYMGPNYLGQWEHLAKVMRSIQVRRGMAWELPKTGLELVK